MSPIFVPSEQSVTGGTSSLQIGRLLIGPPLIWQEQFGDPVGQVGGAVVPGQRTPPAFALTIATPAADGQVDTLAARLIIRRQLRALLNNTPLKLAGPFLYIAYSDDTEQNGWYVPDQATLQDLEDGIGLATGFWQTQSNWYLVGHPRTHREARQVWLKSLPSGSYSRDTLGWVYSTDFSALSTLAVTFLPAGSSAASNTTTGQVVALSALPSGADGGITLFTTGLADLTVVVLERAASQHGLGDVVVYDRMGQQTGPGTQADSDWLEVYGPDWEWSWVVP